MANLTKNDVVTLANLSIGYSTRKNAVALHEGLNATVKQGELVCLLGSNGSGKSTLIKTIAGFIKPQSGVVYLCSVDAKTLTERERAKIVSLVLTERSFGLDMTVFEVVALGRSPYTNFFGRITDDDEKIICETIESVGLKGFEAKQVNKLSDGEVQKTLIAKALVQQTPLIVLDEPTAFLDLPSRIEIMTLLKTLVRKQNKAILLSIHDFDLALKNADKIWLLKKSLPMQSGIPEQLIINGDFNRTFDTDSIQFDRQTGDFAVSKKSSSRYVRIEGNNSELKWLLNALNRIDYQPTDGDCNLTISLTNDSINKYNILAHSELLKSCSSISEVIEYLKESF